MKKGAVSEEKKQSWIGDVEKDICWKIMKEKSRKEEKAEVVE